MFSAFIRRHARATSIATVALAALLPLSLATTSANAVTTSSSKAATTKAVAVKAAVKAQTPRQLAYSMVTGKKYKWSSKQYTCLSALWKRESGWRVHAGKVNGGPYGIPQAYPGKKMGTGWRHSAKTQITWGLKYIDGRYGSPCAADKHQRRTGWY